MQMEKGKKESSKQLEMPKSRGKDLVADQALSLYQFSSPWDYL